MAEQKQKSKIELLFFGTTVDCTVSPLDKERGVPVNASQHLFPREIYK